MAIALRIFGGSLTRKTWLAGGCEVRSRSWVICLSIEGFSLSWYVLSKDGSRRLGGRAAAVVSVTDLGDSPFVVAGSGFVASLMDVGVLGAGCSVLFLDGDATGDSMSIDGGRPLLLFLLHVDLPAGWISFASVLEPLVGVWETSSSVIGFGCASEPSPMTAISPDSCLVSFPLGESLDQKAQVVPAFGAGSCDAAAELPVGGLPTGSVGWASVV
jgi:hypothetical protein